MAFLCLWNWMFRFHRRVMILLIVGTICDCRIDSLHGFGIVGTIHIFCYWRIDWVYLISQYASISTTALRQGSKPYFMIFISSTGEGRLMLTGWGCWFGLDVFGRQLGCRWGQGLGVGVSQMEGVRGNFGH